MKPKLGLRGRLHAQWLAMILALAVVGSVRAFGAPSRHACRVGLAARPRPSCGYGCSSSASTSSLPGAFKCGGPSFGCRRRRADWVGSSRYGLQTPLSSSASSSGDASSSKKPFYITTPIYYVNDRPHIGHAYTSLACDVIARFMRLDGRDVKFLTGTDEHGQKVQESALKQGKSPQQFCDEVTALFVDLLHVMNFSHDQFIRTTDEEHKAAVRHLWSVLESKGAIYKGTYAGWYSVRDETFYTEGELVDGKAPTGAEVQWLEKEESYFFRLSDYEKPLLEHYESHPEFLGPNSRRNEAVSFVKGGLRDLSISRCSFDWGIPVPSEGGDDHIMYVWIDALTNYISALGYPDGEEMARYWPADLHIVGKDILRFHAVYWPAFLMAAGLPVPKRIFAHGWWTKNGEKISKSTGNVIDPIDLVTRFGVDQTRYFLMSEVGFGNDGDFSEQAMLSRVNGNLANEAGNLFQRTISFAHRTYGQAVPNRGTLTPRDVELIEKCRSQVHVCRKAIVETQRLDTYCEAIMELVRDSNKYIDDMAPWKLRKTEPEQAETVLWTLMEVIRHIGILYQPLIPETSGKLLDLLRIPESERTFLHLTDEYSIKAGTPLEKPVPLFPKVDLAASSTPATAAL
jgi:methionyl-tRNA synthetase